MSILPAVLAIQETALRLPGRSDLLALFTPIVGWRRRGQHKVPNPHSIQLYATAAPHPAYTGARRHG